MVLALFTEDRGAICPICKQVLVQRDLGSLVICTNCSNMVLLPSKVAVAALVAAKRARYRQTTGPG